MIRIARNTVRKWKDEYAVDAYAPAFQGADDITISRALNISLNTFRAWYRHKLLFQYSVQKARRDRVAENKAETLEEFVIDKLSPENKTLWNRLKMLSETDDGGNKISALMRTQGKATRQLMWMQAMFACGLNASEACRMTGTGYYTVKNVWEKEEHFQNLLAEIKFHRKEFYESHLMDLVKFRDPSATIFANRTINRDRGYGDQIDVVHSGNVTFGVLEIDKLDLSLECKKELLAAMRALREKTASNSKETAPAAIPEKRSEPVDVEAYEKTG